MIPDSTTYPTPAASQTSAAKEQSSARAGRLLDIERGKGLAIVLVVFAHLIKFDTLAEPAWYAHIKQSIYYFHMPFFMYLSGFVYFLCRTQNVLNERFVQYIGKRAERLLVPFFVFAVVIITGKYLAGYWFYVEGRPDSYWAGYYHLFFATEQSPVLSVWYVLVLFVFSVLTPVLWQLLRQRIWLLLVLAIGLYFVPVSDDFYLDRIFQFYVFFVLGGLLASYRQWTMTTLDRALWVAMPVFLLCAWYMEKGIATMLVVGALSIVALHGLVRLPWFKNDKVLLFLGNNSMAIYLFNTIFIGLFKAIYLKIFPYTGNWVFLLLTVTFCAGLFLPVLLKKCVGRFAMLKPISRMIA